LSQIVVKVDLEDCADLVTSEIYNTVHTIYYSHNSPTLRICCNAPNNPVLWVFS